MGDVLAGRAVTGPPGALACRSAPYLHLYTINNIIMGDLEVTLRERLPSAVLAVQENSTMDIRQARNY